MRYEVAITAEAETRLCQHVLRHYKRGARQEDLCFALWRPSTGKNRFSALVDDVLLPQEDERLLHGNASFSPHYLGRAAWTACLKQCGLAFIHSHPSKGWQGMSSEDVEAERDVIAFPAMATGLPLLGMTAGSDGYWSARFWKKSGRTFAREWCAKVRVIGPSKLRLYFNDALLPPPKRKRSLKRTYETWGQHTQSNIERLHVAIVGLGSVGSVVAESMARIGIRNLTLIDPDRVEEHNLDRLLFATKGDIGRRKVDLARRAVLRSASAHRMSADAVPLSIHNRLAYRKVLDCDVIFSCVDRPVARDVLNFVANAHLIPVIDGGVAVQSDIAEDRIFAAHWRSHIVSPFHQCLRCNGQYDTSMVVMELDGSLDDPSYVNNLPPGEQPSNQNVFPFGMAVAAMEVTMLLRYLVARDWWPLVNQQDYQFVTCETRHKNEACREGCPFPNRRARGDSESPHYLEDMPNPSLWRRGLQAMARVLRPVGKGFRMF